jgi:hypothetical protein
MWSIKQNVIMQRIPLLGVRVKKVGAMTTCTQNLLNLVGNVHGL